MADAGRIIQVTRERVSRDLLDLEAAITNAIGPAEATGADDTTRMAKLNEFFNQEGLDYDLTATEYFAALAQLRLLRAYLQTATFFVPVNKLRL